MKYHVVIEPDVWTIMASVGTVVALFGIIVALWFNRRSLALDRENATATAERAEAAARLSIDSTDRVVEALAAISLSGGGTAAPAPPRVAWSLHRSGGDRRVLTNVGDAKAWHVKIAGHESLSLIDVPEDENLEPGEGVSFYAAPDMGTTDMTITVTWDGDDDGTPGGTWRYPLPM